MAVDFPAWRAAYGNEPSRRIAKQRWIQCDVHRLDARNICPTKNRISQLSADKKAVWTKTSVDGSGTSVIETMLAERNKSDELSDEFEKLIVAGVPLKSKEMSANGNSAIFKVGS